MVIAALVLGLFAYGGYKRQQRQVAALAESGTPRAVAPATAAGAEIAKEVPSGNLPNAPLQHAPDTGVLQPPNDVQPPPNTAAPQVFVRQVPPSTVQPVAVQVPQAREPSPEERRLIAAYEREQQAIAAPTNMREVSAPPNPVSLCRQVQTATPPRSHRSCKPLLNKTGTAN